MRIEDSELNLTALEDWKRKDLVKHNWNRKRANAVAVRKDTEIPVRYMSFPRPPVAIAIRDI